MTDLVAHPPHYTSHPSGVEVITLTRLLPFGPGNAVKYVLRRGLKGNEQQDLEKALWYLDDSYVNEINYRSTAEIRSVAELIIDAEPNELVQTFLRALTTPDYSSQPFPEYSIAAGAVSMLLKGRDEKVISQRFQPSDGEQSR